MRIRNLAVLVLACLLCPVTLSALGGRRSNNPAAELDADEGTQDIVAGGDGDRPGLHDEPTVVRRCELPEVTRLVEMTNLFSLFGFCARYIYKPGYPYTETHYVTTVPGPCATRTVAINYTTEYITLTSTVHVAPSPGRVEQTATATPAYVAPVATAIDSPVFRINLWAPARILDWQDSHPRSDKPPRDLDFQLNSDPTLGCRPNQISLACSIALASRTTTVTVTRTVVPILTEAWRVSTVLKTTTTTTTVVVGCPGRGCFQVIGARGPHPDGHCYNGYGQYLAEPGWEYGDVGGPGPCAARFAPP